MGVKPGISQRKEKHRLRVYENRIVRKIFEYMRQKVTRERGNESCAIKDAQLLDCMVDHRFSRGTLPHGVILSLSQFRHLV
jgi:hypothetical protein